MTTGIRPDDDPRLTRMTHLREESDIKSVGQLCYLVTWVSALGTLEFFLFAIGVIPQDKQFEQFASPEQVRILFWVGTVVMVVNTIGQAVLGYGLTRLHNWARWTVVGLTALSLASVVGFGVPLCFIQPLWGLLTLAVGGILHAMILYPLLKPGSGVVFSTAYREVIRQTPEIRSRMHWLLKLFLGLILLAVGGFVAYLVVSYLRVID